MQLTSVSAASTAATASLVPKASVASQAPVPVASAVTPIEDAQPSLGAKLLGGMAGAQQRAAERHQLLGAISAGLGARFTQIAQGVWATLRGTASEVPTDPAAAG